jgi:uncharacterized protein (TIGR03067 family)
VSLRHLAAPLVAVAALAAFCGVPARPADDKPDAQAEAKRFEGRWRAWRSVKDGDTTADPGDGMLIESNNVQFLWGGDNKGGTATLTLRPGASPREIDLEHTSGGSKGKKQLGIYRFTAEGQLEVSWGEVGVDKRPTQFSGKLGPGAGKPLVIYRSAAFKLPEAEARELKALEGVWRGTALHRAGRAEPADRAKGEGLVIDGDDMQFLWGGSNKGARARFVVDPSKDPKQIEIVYTVGSERYKKRLGVYRLSGDKLELSLSGFNADVRPTAFTGVKGTPGAADLYFSFEREK